VYPVIARAVEEGIGFGLNRAFKHTNHPTREALVAHIEREVMNTLDEVLDYGDE
jgi:hypothetical protein